jgi:NitT/TauT family transport system substrate-binding protein
MRRAAGFLSLMLTGILCCVAAASADPPLIIRTGWLAVPNALQPLLAQKPDVLRHFGKSYIVDPVHFSGTPPQITALAADAIDTAGLSFSALSLAIENAGMSDIRIIAGQGIDGAAGYQSNEFMVLTDSPIHGVADLKGKTLATNGIGGAIDIALRIMLRRHHLEDKRDTTIIEANLPNMRSMLVQRKIDLAAMLPPFSLDPELRRAARVLFTQRDAIGRSQVIVLVARAGFLARNRAAMVDFLEDTLRLQRWCLDPAHHREAVRIVAAVMKQPPDRLDWVFTEHENYRDPDTLPDMKALQSNINLMQELGFLNAGIDIAGYADLSLAEEAARRVQ